MHQPTEPMTARGLGSLHIITPEYPPQSGGVGDYVQQVATGLAAFGDVHVWCPRSVGAANTHDPVQVHRDFAQFSPSELRSVAVQLDRFPAPRRILVQWVPHGFGYRSMNLAFCYWLLRRAKRKGDHIEIMVHEAFLAFEGTWPQYAAALVHRVMTLILLQATERAWVSIPKCEQLWRPYAMKRPIPFEWLPLPSNVPLTVDAEGVAAVRSRYVSGDDVLVGHFGTFGTSIQGLLEPVVIKVLDQNCNVKVLMIGPGHDFVKRLLRKYPTFAGRIFSTGPFASTDPELSKLISAADVMIQPYPDGVTSRRTSLMASLNHGKPIVTTIGPGTESFWASCDAVVMTKTSDLDGFARLVKELCANTSKRAAMARSARNLYRQRFDVAHAVAALRLAPEDLACVS